MNIIETHIPRRLVYGDHCFQTFLHDIRLSDYKELFIVADANITQALQELKETLRQSKIRFTINTEIKAEPTISDFQAILHAAEATNADAVAGIGGGSVLDVAKLIAALYKSADKIDEVVGKDKLSKRSLPLYCIPTTAGTGSEVSPNAILLDEKQHLKVGIISPYLIPDASYVDPVLTYSVPYHITAATGIDALTHCLEAYTNKNAHPFIDMYALEGIKLIFHHLEKACENDAVARANVALGSLYGGICLGPVNTAAVHALAYPLGSEYKIPHGISNALLLPHVIEANLPFANEKYATVALAIGADNTENTNETARNGIELLKKLCSNVGIPASLNAFNISKGEVINLAKSAMKVERLLKNNPRTLTEEEVQNIYYKLF
ncbi:MAG: iron-containing alcohol dehydrogenase [Cyclobacteriaceae bacterium]|nr:iron-containing alcohol dehydrogenase [Cyclobacteriaceae bacterium]